MNRRRFLQTAAPLALGLTVPACVSPSPPAAGWAEPFDREMRDFMEARGVPGGALAVMKEGRLVHARGYGWADRERQVAVRPDSLFRLASVSKPITGLAVLRLIESGRLAPETKAFPLLGLTSSHSLKEARLADITLRQLLQHTGGWDRDRSFDPMFRSEQIAAETKTARPASSEAVIRYMLGQPLDFTPGTRYAYSNFGYCVLGRVIEKVTGRRYEDYVREAILRPAGIRRMRIGASLEAGRAPGEVRYYTAKPERARNVFPDGPEEVSWPYGGFHLEAMDAHGGWIGSAVDLLRLVAALDTSGAGALLRPETKARMVEPPPPPVSRQADGQLAASYYGAGWMVRPVGDRGGVNLWHSGSLPGTNTLLVRLGNGLSWAALFNQRSEDKAKPDSALDAALHRAAARITDWPRHNLFGSFA